jgi:nickel-dependent lactate racemase
MSTASTGTAHGSLSRHSYDVHVNSGGSAMTTNLGGPTGVLDPSEVRSFVSEQLAGIDLDGRSLCLVIPDATRKCPLPLLLDAVQQATAGRVSACTAVIALGTHAPMSEAAMRTIVGSDALKVVNHEWWEDSTFVRVGALSRDTVAELSGGRLDEAVDIRINRLVPESDVTLIIGPVLPHEVVGFSGGNKYLFPGLSGQELIDVTHWLGALITSAEMIGMRGITPVRALVNAAAALVPGERHALCVVVDRATGGLHSLAFGEPGEAWAAAADVAAETHVEYLDRPVRRVLSLVSPRYEDLWTGAKGFYKVEPVVADGGEVVLYAPHITQIAITHPELDALGYHCRDFFLAQWDRYRDHHRGELAHSTHLFGAGTYDRVEGERQRVRVTLATGIPEDVVRRANLGYLDPADVDLVAWEADAEALVVPDAGEVLFRLRP